MPREWDVFCCPDSSPISMEASSTRDDAVTRPLGFCGVPTSAHMRSKRGFAGDDVAPGCGSRMWLATLSFRRLRGGVPKPFSMSPSQLCLIPADQTGNVLY
jgi:hypothetical protein